MLTKIRQLMTYNKAVSNVDLEDLLTPNRLKKAPKFPDRKKTYRTLSLARELRKLGKDYWYFQDNIIALDFMYGRTYRKKVINICGSMECYKVRVDIWDLCGSGRFFYKEFDYTTGACILFELVALEILDSSFIHSELNTI